MEIIERNNFYQAFPRELKGEIDNLYDQYSFDAIYPNHHTFRINLGQEEINIPTRVYVHEKQFTRIHNLPKTQQMILGCMLSRHYDGFVRQKHLENILTVEELWVAPYILQLIGEYVVEILNDIYKNLDSINIDFLKHIMSLNPNFWNKTKSRVISYWDCYYRQDYYNKEDYVGMKIIAKLK
jgi:hypothetical protein